MDQVVATSRGRGIDVNGTVLPGADLVELTAEAIRLIKTRATQDVDWPVITYMIGGLPDSVTKVVDYYGGMKYEEVIFPGSPLNTAADVLSTIRASMDSISVNTGAIPIYATIAPMSVETWNNTRMKQGKTSHLLHFREYANMQELHNETIVYINSAIVDINRSRGLSTPHFASQVLQKRGMDMPYRFRHNRLVDGCHPTESVIAKWKEEMTTTITRNRAIFQ